MSEQRDYWTLWALDKAGLTIRLTQGDRHWDFPPLEAPLFRLDPDVAAQLEKAANAPPASSIVEVMLPPGPPLADMDFLSEQRSAVFNRLHPYLNRLILRFVPDDAEPPYPKPDVKTWSRDIVKHFTATLRSLMKNPQDREELKKDFMRKDRSDDMGTAVPDVLGDDGRKALWQAIDDTLAAIDTSECDKVIDSIPGQPLVLSDWALSEWPNVKRRAKLPEWLHFLAALKLKKMVWAALACDPDSFAIFKAEEKHAPLAAAYPAEFAGALDDAEFRHEISGPVLPGAYKPPKQKSRTSIVFSKMLATLQLPAFSNKGFREIDRRAFLSVARNAEPALVNKWVALFQTSFWQSLSPDDIERWLKLGGYGVLFYDGSIDDNFVHLPWPHVLDFWHKVADSQRSSEMKQALFQTALDISLTHHCIEYEATEKRLAEFRKNAAPEITHVIAT